MRNIKCLVTGGSGFIGSHVCDVLIASGYEVICVDNLITGNKKNIEHLLGNPHFHFIQHDIIQPLPEELLEITKGISYLYHLASPASPPQYQKYAIETLEVNSVGTHHMLELARQEGANFLLASTSEVYGNPLEHPQKESYWGNVNPNGIRACYDEAKRFSEALTMEYLRKFQTHVRIVRIFNTYGPRMQVTDGRVISNFVNQAIAGKDITMYGDGSQTRSFCYVADLVAGLQRLTERDGLDGEVVNLGFPREHTIKEIADIVLKLSKSSSHIVSLEKKADDPERRKPDISKAKKLLEWEPTTSLEEGLSKTITYFSSI